MESRKVNNTEKQTHKTSNKSGLSSLNYRLIEFNPSNASDFEWEKFFDIRKKLHYEHTPDDPFGDREVLKKKMSFKDPYKKVWRSLVILNDDEESVIGYAYVSAITEASPEYEDNKHVAWSYAIIDKDYRRNGIGTDLVRLVILKLKEYKRITIQVWNEYKSGQEFGKYLGGKLAYRNFENRLNFNEIDWEKMNNWLDEGKKRVPGVIIKTFEEVPKEIIEEYVKLFTETANEAPLEDLEGKEFLTRELRRHQEARERDSGTNWITKISIETDGKISGLTEILYNPKESYLIDQELTGVKKEYRGRGLGKMLKADMALHIRNKYPHIDYIRTGNATTNKPMLAINHEMGYKETKRFETYKFKVNELEKLL